MPTIQEFRMVQATASSDQWMNGAKSRKRYEAELKQVKDRILEMIGGLTA
ncbi:hypothetical protein [Synechococcus sp. CBW1006]|nr:hypothetical protein [Synechococcus sp. CBW1006]QPN65285.1 hypothetical protein H8F26_09585 [Synechococcus sp. CBW1006]